MKKQNWKRANWLQNFENQTVEAGIYEPGRVDWDTAYYFYNTGSTVPAAVARLLEHKTKKEGEA